ncbi:hypothetical protein LOAG_13603 [Loa loa]|uniref:Uncharacterized protein n=1 Tax=Loa loa TaxID=7209 RepID=A0A1S0TJ89_LOALO|nr:hypothetical protein LOAG_13603 [Loa loa]EFO14912.1 hypothetical protein LOAG_13603 [Loa loa]
MGDVNADINYTPTPDGIAFFCETPSVLYSVLNSNGHHLDRTNYPLCFGPKNKELKSQRCILLQLISSMNDCAYDLLGNDFFFENEVPPCLFRYTTKENCPFTVRSFAGTRFGCHRSRPDHKAMRRIQHAAAFLAVANDNTYSTASGSHQESIQFGVNPTSDNFYYNQPYANNNFASIISPSVPLTSSSSSTAAAAAAATATASVVQRNCDAMSAMTTSSNAITNAVTSNESNRLLLNPLLTSSNPLPESITCNAGHVANQFYSLSPVVEIGSDFSSWNCYPTASDIKVDHAKVDAPKCDERSNYHFIYPYNSSASVTDSYNSYPLETAPSSTGRSFLHCVNPIEPISETPSFLSFPASLSNLNYTPSGNPENQIHNLELNNLHIAELQYNLSRMSFADGAASTSSTFATNQPKMN